MKNGFDTEPLLGPRAKDLPFAAQNASDTPAFGWRHFAFSILPVASEHSHYFFQGRINFLAGIRKEREHR